MAMRFQIKKLLEGYDPADLIEQSMYCFGSDSGGDDGSEDTSDSYDANMGLSDQEVSEATGDVGQNIGLDAFGGTGGSSSTQSTAGIQSTAGDMLGGSMATIDPVTGQTTTYSPTQVPALELMKPVPYDIFNIVDKVNQNLKDRDAQGLYSQVTRDAMGNVTGSFNTAPMFGLGFMPNVTTYTGFDQNPYNEDMSISGGESETVKPATTNPVSGQPVCPDGYRFDNDLQACRLDTARPSMTNNPNPFPSGDAFYRATSLDQAPMNVPSGFDFNRANQNFVNQFAYRPANFTNQMGLSGFTPFRRS
jgi:hypothetical protein